MCQKSNSDIKSNIMNPENDLKKSREAQVAFLLYELQQGDMYFAKKYLVKMGVIEENVEKCTFLTIAIFTNSHPDSIQNHSHFPIWLDDIFSHYGLVPSKVPQDLIKEAQERLASKND